MIKTVLYDYGGVLTAAGRFGSVSAVISELFGVDVPWQHLDPLHQELRAGYITSEEFFEGLRKAHKSERIVTEQEWHELSADIFERAEPVYEQAAQLRKHGIKTGIVSNIYQMTADMLRQLGNYEGFDPLILSCEVHLVKPQPEIYQLMVEKSGVKPEEILFIDDLEHNLLPARSLGMHTILSKNTEQVARDIQSLVEKENGVIV